MEIGSKYIPVWISEQRPETSINRFQWLVTWCAHCRQYFMIVKMLERIACPYCIVPIEPSTALFNEGPPPQTPQTEVPL